MDIRIAAIAFALGLPLSASAQQARSAQEQQARPEEIVITGERSVLRTQMMETEKRAYEVFNKFNDEKRFNISCSMHQPTGTHFSRQVCEPDFVNEAAAAHARDFLGDWQASTNPVTGMIDTSINHTSQVTHLPMEAVIGSQLPDYHRKIKQIAEQHPEFLEEVIRYSKIREQYEKATTTMGK